MMSDNKDEVIEELCSNQQYLKDLFSKFIESMEKNKKTSYEFEDDGKHKLVQNKHEDENVDDKSSIKMAISKVADVTCAEKKNLYVTIIK